MSLTFTRRVNVQLSSGLDPRYTANDTEFWVVRYTDKSGTRREFVHRGPESVKRRIESMGIAFDSNVEVNFHR